MRLDRVVREIRAATRTKELPVDEPTSVWTGTDVLDGDPTPSLTVILRTTGCRWRGCTMCGYVYDCATHQPTQDDLVHQLREAVSSAPGGPYIVKIYTSGSFLDEREVPEQARQRMYELLAGLDNVQKVIVETRPEHVTPERIEEGLDLLGRFGIAVGVETSTDLIGEECINKGFTYEDFTRAAQIAREEGATVRAYLLLKPPFLSESDAILDMQRSIKSLAPYAETISMNLMTVQRGTLVERLWERGGYRPPWLWSAAHILQDIDVDAWLISDPVGAGTERGPHNCGECDTLLTETIRRFSHTQDKTIFDQVECDCHAEWQQTIKHDNHGYGSPI